MLLLTDRIQEGKRLQQTLLGVGPCQMLRLGSSVGAFKRPKAIICDVALDTMEAVERLRQTLRSLAVASTTPVVSLLRDPSHLSEAQARMAGATFVLPYQSTHADLCAQVRVLLAQNDAAEETRDNAVLALKAGASDVQALLTAMFKSGSASQPISTQALSKTGDTLLSTVDQAGLQAWLDLVKSHDDVTYQHCLLVAGLVAAFSLELGLSPKLQKLIAQAALVHDIGKAQIPHQILNKNGKLTEQETLVMQTHAARGHAMLRDQEDLDPILLDVVRHHHEYLDGSGYPDRIEGDRISRIVRMVTICDIYAALVERRPYKKPMPPEVALGILGDMGPRLDSNLMRAFRSMILHK